MAEPEVPEADRERPQAERRTRRFGWPSSVWSYMGQHTPNRVRGCRSKFDACVSLPSPPTTTFLVSSWAVGMFPTIRTALMHG